MASRIAAKERGGRPATGSIVWADPETKTQPIGVRVTRADSKRKVIPFEPGTSSEDAIALAPLIAERARFAVDEWTSETLTEYEKRWREWRTLQGLGCVDADRATLARHVLPQIGHIEVRAVTRDDLKRLVMMLDAKARRGFSVDVSGNRKPFGCKTAANAWGVVRALFRDAQRSKNVELCVRDDNPSDGVQGPELGARKAKAYLWPSEFLTLISSPAVPPRWRRVFAIAVYTYARAGELAALDWSDVDLEHRTIHIHRSTDRVRDGKTKATKTNTARRIPIEPALLPLLVAMHREANGRGLVLRMPSIGGQSKKLRTYLKRAGVTRADLFTSDATRKPMTFHDLRATGVTWGIVRGDESMKVMQRAGHADFATTQIYLRDAENLAVGFGTVFPALPADLLAKPTRVRGVSASVSAFGLPAFIAAAKNKAFPVELTGIEPVTSCMPCKRSPN
jgi:integrase